MIFYLHYILLTSGLSGTSVLLAVYFKAYSDASQGEIVALLMAIPFVSLFIKPIFCSMADRRQSHHLSLMLALVVMMVGFTPFLVIPFFPVFFKHYQRHSWYFLVISCLIGSSGLGVAWSLGDCLAVNHAQRTGVPFGRMRLMGTLSWGIYGFIIGQINEHPSLPKYLPSFILLHCSVAIELILLAFWDRRCFEMVDALANANADEKQEVEASHKVNMSKEYDDKLGEELEMIKLRSRQIDNLAESVPSSLGGTLKINPKAVKALFEVLAANDEELVSRLKVVEEQQASCEKGSPETNKNNYVKNTSLAYEQNPTLLSTKPNKQHVENGINTRAAITGKNPQLILLKMILVEDGRVLKYIILFTAFGIFVAPINFFFVSVEDLCRTRGYNFSQLAGAVLMSQALIETVAFLVVPWLLNNVTRWTLMSFGLLVMSMKFVFYAGWYYDSDVSPYWAVLAEWSHGLPYGIFCTILADVSLMFANQSRLFIPELRRLGFLASGETDGVGKEAIEAEERSIKMALRATMQALFSGFMDGLGIGAGSLLCGLFSDLYSYHTVWMIFSALTLGTLALHLLVETTSSRWSDSYKPIKGTKAYEIMELSRTAAEAQRRRLAEAKRAKLSAVEKQQQSKKSIQVVADGNNGANAPPM